MGWSAVAQLVLYNLTYQTILSSSTNEKAPYYFKLKEDICDFLNNNWSLLMGDKKMYATWKNTISGTLSVNNKIFKNGINDLGQRSWWALTIFEAPIGPYPEILSLGGNPNNIIINNRINDVKTVKEKEDKIKIEKVKEKEIEKIEDKETTYNIKNNLKVINKMDNLSDTSTETEDFNGDNYDQWSSTSDEEEGQEQVIKHSINKFKDDINKAKSNEVENNSDNNNNSNNNENNKRNYFNYGMEWNGKYLNQNKELEIKKVKREQVENGVFFRPIIIKKEPLKVEDKSDIKNNENITYSETDEKISDKITINNGFIDFMKEMNNSNLVYMSHQQEWEVLQKLQNSTQPLPSYGNRMLRKLQLKRNKRALELKEFNIDKFIFNYLHKDKATIPLENNNSGIVKNNEYQKAIDEFYYGKSSMSNINKKIKEFKINATPYSNSFASRIYGNINSIQKLENQSLRISPYNQVVLQPYIRRVYKLGPNKLPVYLKTLYLIQNHQYKNHNLNIYEWDLKIPIDFCYMDNKYLDQVNTFLQSMFWPGIDMKESLQYPEYSILAFYGYQLIGVGFMTPECYITYLAVDPKFQKIGIAKFMLYHLAMSAKHKDLTLHVSATNPALILYQKFTFKPEGFQVGFYGRYLREKVDHNALFCRLRM
ncbi:hypothetical protein K502DRAFT_304119 [Neoconidiobolus thromboides FSU 785]|nr:hypothetical protein K502DRAFT_304119 [Neoconidiobolus thromboides FSU 785]